MDIYSYEKDGNLENIEYGIEVRNIRGKQLQKVISTRVLCGLS